MACVREPHTVRRDRETARERSRGESNPARARESGETREMVRRESACFLVVKYSNTCPPTGWRAAGRQRRALHLQRGAQARAGGRSSLPPLVRGGRGAVALAIAVGVASWFAASPQGLCGTGCTPLLCPPLPHARVSVFCALWVCVLLLLLLLLLLLFRRPRRRRGVRGRRGRRRVPRPVRRVRVLVLEHDGEDLAGLLARRNGDLDPVPAGRAETKIVCAEEAVVSGIAKV